MGTKQQVQLLEKTLLKINVALLFSEPAPSKDLDQVEHLLQELVVPDDQVIHEWKEIGFKLVHKNPKQAKELLSFLDSIAVHYQDEAIIPKTLTFYLYDVVIDFMNKDNIVEGMSMPTDGERADFQLFVDICEKLRSVFASSKKS
ncbi:hypothetical protein [Saccharibacillus sp. JS10]|uniref:hypothetical protein n=1 Tax=Saccharibacillus sp. JS10 TaxID=2950552 RepID=UPI00210B88D1|nr:hypothetical protein [Saccharibacillus sp. JS10]MCQ4087542.1 hypothetical protein [Saccharibacillus sp. JS10]